MEFWLSIIKVIAIIAMIVGGAAIMMFGLAKRQTMRLVSNLFIHDGFMPNGIGGVIASFAVVMFAFGELKLLVLLRVKRKTRKPLSQERLMPCQFASYCFMS